MLTEVVVLVVVAERGETRDAAEMRSFAGSLWCATTDFVSDTPQLLTKIQSNSSI